MRERIKELSKIYTSDDENAKWLEQEILDLFIVSKQYIGDSDLVICDLADPSKINDLRAGRINATPCTKGDDSLRAGVKRMMDYKIIVAPNNETIKKEFRNYVWNDKKAGVPIKREEYSLDAIRYIFDFLNKTKR